MLDWNSWAVPGFLLFLGGTGLATLVYRNRPGRRQNRLLALALSSIAFAWLALSLSLSMETGPDAYAAWIGDPVFLIVHLAAYLAFLGTLPTPISRPFRSRSGRWTLALLALAGIGLVVGATKTLYPAVIDPALGVEPWARTGAAPVAWWAAAWNLTKGAVFLLGVAVAVQYLLRSPEGSPARSQARIYLAAFGTRDLLFTVGVLAFGLAPVATSFPWALITWLSWWIGGAVGLTLLTYGFLKYRLFDIDLKVKWGIRRSTMAAVFVAVFFIAGELAETFFGDVFGPYVGVIVAGVLVFFLAPLQRLADRVGDAAMPSVEDSEEYRERRREEIYRAQLEELMSDEQVTAKERRALLRLQEDLGLEAEAANRLEREVLGARGGEVA